MTDSTAVQEYLEQMQETSHGLVNLSNDELLAMLDGSPNHWQGQQVADLLADMPEGLERTTAQQRFADIKPAPPQLRTGPNDITTMDVGVMKSD